MITFAKPSRWWHVAPYAATATHVGTERTRRGAAMVAAAAIGLTGAFALSGAMTTAQDLLTSRATSVAPVTEVAVDAASLPSGSMYHVVDQIGARELWQQGITGAGVNVAVIDTGIAEVESLGSAGKVAAVVDLSSEAGDSFRVSSIPTVTARTWPASSQDTNRARTRHLPQNTQSGSWVLPRTRESCPSRWLVVRAT